MCHISWPGFCTWPAAFHRQLYPPLLLPQLEAVHDSSTFASLMDDDFDEEEEGGEYDEVQEVLRVDASKEVDESLLVGDGPLDISCSRLEI